MDFRARRSAGGGVGLLLFAAACVVAFALAATIRTLGPGPPAALLFLAAIGTVPLLAWLAYWLWGYFSLSYSLSRDALVIRWAASRQVVPMGAITHLIAGREYAAKLRGLRWPGYEVGRSTVALDDGSGRDTLVYATTPPSGQLLVVTPHLAYAISPADPAAFVEEFKVRRRLGPVQQPEQETVQPRWAQLTLWRDWLALRLVALAIGLNALAFAWLLWHYPGLPEEVALQYSFNPETGTAVAGPLRDRALAWTLPLMGLTILGTNFSLSALVHARGRVAAILLSIGAVLAQLAIGVVLLRL